MIVVAEHDTNTIYMYATHTTQLTTVQRYIVVIIGGVADPTQTKPAHSGHITHAAVVAVVAQ